MKCSTRSQAVQRYGAIDFASKYWSHQRDWLKMFEIPKDWFPNWHVLDTKHPVEHIACNKDIHEPLMKALTEIHDKKMGDLLHSFDGCFNIRMVRGSASAPSTHSYGLAIDLNASSNGLGSIRGGFYDHPEFVKCFTGQGFDWGGNFHGRKDPMHFSYAWE